MDIVETGKNVLSAEANAIQETVKRIDESFKKAVEILYATQGRIVITGMGKSGLIGRKISATLTSTGSPSIFLHPSEAMHGDLGMIKNEDAVLALSTSGETHEVLRLLSFVKRVGVKLISLVGNPNSTLAQDSDVFINCKVEKEACPIGYVPTTSTTVSLAVGDAIAIALMEKKGFSEEAFRLNHPGGAIGKKLLKVKSLMHTGSELPVVDLNTRMIDAIHMINKKKFGIAIVITASGEVKGVITDGDLRRSLLKGIDFNHLKAGDCMTNNPLTIDENKLAVEALNIMEKHLITSLVVVEKNQIKGLIHLHDLWRTEMI